MKFSTLSIARPSLSSSSSLLKFWGEAKRLVIIVATTEVADVLVAYGVDPALGEQVFETSIRAHQLGSFFKLLIDGDAGVGTAVAAAGAPTPFGIDIPAQDPPPPGPKALVVTTYATAVRSDESLAELGGPVAA